MWRVVIERKNAEGKTLREERRYPPGVLLVGRDPGCDLIVSDPGVSRRHLRISPGGSGVRIEDLNSANGTWHNGERVTTLELTPPFSLQLGDGVAFTLSLESPEKRRAVLTPRNLRLLLIFLAILGGVLVLLLPPSSSPVITTTRLRTGATLALTSLPDLPDDRLYLWAKLKERDAHFIPGSLGLAVRAYARIATGASAYAVTAGSLLESLKNRLEERLSALQFEALRAVKAREIPRARRALEVLKLESRSYDLKFYEEALEFERTLDRWEGSHER